jgi:hypothetical protein
MRRINRETNLLSLINLLLAHFTIAISVNHGLIRLKNYLANYPHLIFLVSQIVYI